MRAVSLVRIIHLLELAIQPGRIIRMPWNTLALIEFKNPFCNVIQKVTIVRYNNHSSCIVAQVPLKPQDTATAPFAITAGGMVV